jgi:hypothetical protein
VETRDRPVDLPGRSVDYESFTDLQACCRCAAGWQFEHRSGASSTGDSIRREGRHDLEDALVAVEEHGIDWESHQEGVDRVAGLEQKALVRRQLLPAHQAYHAPTDA